MVTCLVVGDDGRPLSGVAVSDGREVVTTGADGRAVLTAEGRRFVWVSRPDGRDTADWFHRLADGDDEPVTFVLRSTDQPVPFTFAQITDLHMSDVEEPAQLPLADSVYGLDERGQLATRPLTGVPEMTAALAEVASAAGPHGPPRFMVATGDLTDHGTSGEFSLLRRALATSPVPVHLLPGNHDHYGHLHEPHPDDRPLDSAGMGTGTVTRFEEHVGPRWWSLTHAGLRLVAIDWFSHRLGIDADDQEEWLAADLATAPAGAPVLFLTHDQMPEAFFERVAQRSPHVRIVGSLSGHWHTSRVVRVNGQLHANTGNATFGSFDWAPAHARLTGWDGERLTFRTIALESVVQRAEPWLRDGSEAVAPPAGDALRTVTFAAAPVPAMPEGARWSVRLPGAVHLARPARVDLPDGAAVVVAWSDDDRAAGGMACHDLATGGRRWQVELDAPARAGVVWSPSADLVIGVSVSGGVVAVEASSGAVRWRAQLGDRTTTWVHATPVDLGDAVAVGEPRRFVSLDLDDGSQRWVADQPGHFENVATLSNGVLHDGVLVVPFSMMPDHTVGLDPLTGATVWRRDGHPIRSPVSDVVADPDGPDVLLARLGGRIERLAAATGEVRWAARVRAAFVPGRPLIVDDGLIVTTALGAVHRFGLAEGAERWATQLPGDALLAMGPYRRHGLAVVAGPTLVSDGDGSGSGRRIAQVTGDGALHALDPEDGSLLGSIALGVPMTVPAIAVDGEVVVAGAEGTLARIAMPR